jgi:hypothetical protein
MVLLLPTRLEPMSPAWCSTGSGVRLHGVTCKELNVILVTIILSKKICTLKSALFKTLFLGNQSSTFEKVGQVWTELEKMNIMGHF